MTEIESPDLEFLAGIAEQFGIDRSAVRPLPAGDANHTWRIGDDLVLRLPRNSGPLTDDLRKEAVVIPIARAAGIQTPEIVAFAEWSAIPGVPYLLTRHIPGADLDRVTISPDAAVSVYRAVGQQLAKLHTATPDGTVTTSAIPADLDDDDPRQLLEPLVRVDALDGETADWLRSWFDRLAEFVPPNPAVVLIHGDIAPRNLMVDPADGTFQALIDWGDAAFADPAMDFAKLPLAMLPATLEGYLDQDDWSGNELSSWQARAFRYHLHWAVAATGRREPGTGTLRPPGPALARLLVILRFLAGTLDDRWDWLRWSPTR